MNRNLKNQARRLIASLRQIEARLTGQEKTFLAYCQLWYASNEITVQEVNKLRDIKAKYLG